MCALVVAMIDEAVAPLAALPPVRMLRWRSAAGGLVYEPMAANVPAMGVITHGTRMAQLIAEQRPADLAPPQIARIDCYVVHPGADIPIEVQIIAALQDIAGRAQAQLINLSWSSSPNPAYAERYSTAVGAIAAAGQLLVVAAGNFSTDLDRNPHWPVCIEHRALLSVSWVDAAHRLLRAGYGQRSVQLALVLEPARLRHRGVASSFAAAPADCSQLLCSSRSQPSTSMATALVSRRALQHWQSAAASSGMAVADALRQQTSAARDPLTRQRLRYGCLALA